MENFYFKFKEGEFFGDIVEALKKLGGIPTSDSVPSHLVDGVFTLDKDKKIVFYPCGTGMCTKLLFSGTCLTSNFRLCVYFTGDNDNAKEVINFLEFLGGRDNGYTAAVYDDCLIFIDEDGDINECDKEGALGSFLQNYGLELSQDLFMLDSEGPSIEILGNYYSRREVTKLLKTLQTR